MICFGEPKRRKEASEMKRNNRDDFLPSVKEVLAKRAGYRCSNPECRIGTSGPNSDPEKATNVGVAAHICAAAEGGPRYDLTMTAKERASAENGIWLCQCCAHIIDNDQIYTVELLKEWKRQAEDAARREIRGLNTGASTLPADAALIKKLNECLTACRKNHPSFALMKIAEQTSFGHLKGEDSVSPVWRIIRESWARGEKKVVLIEGEGGSGKTVALFSIVSPGGEPPIPAVYISLCELDYLFKKKQSPELEDYLEKKYKRCKDGILRLSEQEWTDRPQMLILLDGVNEVQEDVRRSVLECVRRWSEHRGVQLVFSSRPLGDAGFSEVFDPGGRDEILRIRLEPLNRETVRACLKEYPRDLVRIPKEDSPLWEILCYPLFLNLYITTAKLPPLPCGYQLSVRNPESRGALIWNYFQRELLRRNSDMVCEEADKEKWIVHYSFAFDYLLPELACWMLGNDPYRIDKASAARTIEQALRAYDPDKLPLHLRGLWSHYESRRTHSARPRIDPEDHAEWENRVLYDTGLLLPKNGKAVFQFVHEHFRDCLAGIHLVNQVEMELPEDGKKLDQIPALWQEHIPKEALEYAAELMPKNVFQAIWTANRLFWKRNAELWSDEQTLSAEQWEQKQRAETLLYNLLELRRIQIQKGLADRDAGLNFSYMDLRSLSLSRYCSTAEADMRLFRNPAHSAMTRLSEETFRGPGHSGTISCVAALPGHRCVTAAYDGTLRIWDLTTGQRVALLTDRTEHDAAETVIRCGCMALAPTKRKGTLIVNGADDGLLRVWDARTGQLVRRLAGHTGPISAVIALPDGKIASSAQDGSLQLWDPNRDEALWKSPARHDSAITALAVLRCGDPDDEDDLDYRLVCGTKAGTIQLWNRNGTPARAALTGHCGAITDVVCTPNGDDKHASTIVSADETGKLIAWDRSCHKRELLKAQKRITRLALLPNGRNDRILVGDSGGGVAVCGLSDPRPETVREPSEKNCPVNCFVAFGQARDCPAELKDCYLLCLGNKTPELWGTDNRMRRALPGHEDKVRCAAILPNGQCVTGAQDRSLRVWNPSSGRCLQTMYGRSSAITDVTVLSKHRVAACSWDRKIRIWNLDRRECERILPAEPADGHSRWILAVERFYEPERQEERIVSASKDHSVMLWSPDCCEPVQRIPAAHDRAVTSVAVRADGSFVTGSGDKRVKLWELRQNEWCDQVLPGRDTEEADGVDSVAAIGGRWIAASAGSNLLLWDLEKLSRGETLRCQIRMPKEHERYINCLDTDGENLLVSCSRDEKIAIWDLRHPKRSVNVICAEAQGNLRSVRLLVRDGRRMLVSGGDDRRLHLWDAESGEECGQLEGHTDWVRCIAVLPEGWFPNGQLISGSSDMTLRIWDLERGACVCKLEAMEADVFGRDFSEADLTDSLREMLRQNGATI